MTPRAVKAALVSFGLLFLIAVGSGAWFLSFRDRHWAEVEASVQDLYREVREAPPLPRIPLGRPLVPGNAWDDYLKALYQAGQPLPAPGANLRGFLERDSHVPRAEVEEFVSSQGHRIDLLRSGVRREIARIPPTTVTVNGLQLAGPNRYYSTADQAWLSMAKARLLAEEGKTAPALDLLTDVCLFARDWAGTRLAGGPGYGLSAMEGALNELRDLLQSDRVRDEHVRELDRTLALLDEYFPDTCAPIRDDLMRLGERLIRVDQGGGAYHADRAGPGWRFGFSARLQGAASFSFAQALVRQEEDLAKRPWAEARSPVQDLRKAQQEHPDSLVSDGLLTRAVLEFTVEARGHLRLLRVAAHYRATGELLGVADPVAGTIQSRFTDTTLLAWKQPRWSPGPWRPTAGDKHYVYWNTIEVPKRR